MTLVYDIIRWGCSAVGFGIIVMLCWSALTHYLAIRK